MPFIADTFHLQEPEPQPNSFVRLIDKALELFGPNGENWIKDMAKERFLRDGSYHWGYCIIGAVFEARQKLDLDQIVEDVVLDTIVNDVDLPVAAFNDGEERTFDEVRAELLKARKKLETATITWVPVTLDQGNP